MEKLLKQLYQSYKSEDLKDMSKEELIKLIEKQLDILDKRDLEAVIRRQRYKDYQSAYDQYTKATSKVVDGLLELVELFETTEVGKDEVLAQITDILKKDERMLISRELPHRLVGPILYALDKKDLDTSATLMSRRIQMELDGGTYGDIRYRHADHIDRMDLLDKFVGIIAEQCDKEQADKYIKELGEGKYTSRYRIIDGHYYYVGEGYMREMYEEAKVGTQQKPTKEKGREF